MLTDGQVRRIAAEWHDGQGSALYALTSTGAVRWDAREEVDALLARKMGGPALRLELEGLRAYLEAVEAETTDDPPALDDDLPPEGFLRGPLPGWVRAWDETPARELEEAIEGAPGDEGASIAHKLEGDDGERQVYAVPLEAHVIATSAEEAYRIAGALPVHVCDNIDGTAHTIMPAAGGLRTVRVVA